MAITRHLAELILAEHRYRPIHGEVLLLGRQLVLMTPDEAQALVAKAEIPQASGARIDYDKTPHPYEKRLISDASFFSLFSDAVVRACDVSDYEGAEIIFNLSEGVPPALIQKFDFVYNGSVLDNMFDAAAGIRNISRMLKPEGVVFHYEGAAHAAPAYLKFTPDWFFDYYALNGFADCQAYLATYTDVHRDRWSMHEWSAFTDAGQLTMPMLLGTEAMVVAVVQNSPSATVDRTPLQNIYRSDEHAPYLAAHSRFAASKRRQTIRQVFPEPEKFVAPHGNRFLRMILPKSPSPEVAAPPPGHVYLGLLGSTKFLEE
jgi:SAM-dependent methyltransferase